jgi:hypothetical protein
VAAANHNHIEIFSEMHSRCSSSKQSKKGILREKVVWC